MLASTAFTIAFAFQGIAADSPLGAEDALVVTEISETVLMVEGFGGNATVISTMDGVFLVDSMMQPASEALNALIVERFGASPRAMINTHHHSDHSIGNDVFNASGTLTIAHTFLRHRIAYRRYSDLSERWVEPRPVERLPVTTYEDEMSLFWGAETIRIYHPEAAHTGGDSVAHASLANVIATGDIFVHGVWPIIDFYAGGSVDGTIAALAEIYELADDETVIIPGHGPLATRADVLAYSEQLLEMRGVTLAAIAEGISREAFVESDPFLIIAPEWQPWFVDSGWLAGEFHDNLGVED